MKIGTHQLLDDLLKRTHQSSAAAQQFKALSTQELNFKSSPTSWSILECIEHLNLYGDFYLPEIEKQILKQKQTSASSHFKSGFIGNYFANLMLVKNGKVKKMQSPKDKNPINSALSSITIDRFLKQQEALESLLVQARKIDLVKTKAAISLTKAITLRLGDTFRFFVYHIERHIVQAQRVQANHLSKVAEEHQVL
jgi:hypothetical protein